MESKSGNVLENTRGADWERELVTHYTGIGTEVRENYREGSFQDARVGAGATGFSLKRMDLVAGGFRDVESGIAYFPVTDAQGNVRGYATTEGLKSAYDYYAYGTAVEYARAPVEDNKRWQGKEYDEPIRKLYFGSRYFDPFFGMWMSPDPAGQFANPYTYGGDPLNYVDPNGEWVHIVVGAVIGTKFGLWYSWDAAQSVCPEGWRLPYGKEWRTLGKLNSNKSLMNGGKVLFNTEKFHARLTGGYFVTSDGSKWSGANSYAYYWNIEDLSSKEGGHASLSSTGDLSVDVDPDDNYIVDKSSLLAVRCILESHGTMVDPRDGQTYKTIRLGDNVWMAENLNYDIAGSVARDDAPNDGLKYGRYYSKASAEIACPSGWHLSTASDWKPIYDIVDSVVLDGISLKSMEGWDESHLGQDDFEMNIVPAGDCFYSTIDKVVNCSVTGENARFWMEGGSTYYQNENSLGMGKGDDTDYLSVRCVKD